MLTGELVRYYTDDTHIIPLFISRRESQHYLGICQKLIDMFQEHRGQPRGALAEALERFESASTDYKIYRGLAKLLFDRSLFAAPWDGEYSLLRQTVFEQAQLAYPIVVEPDLLHHTTRKDVLETIAEEQHETPDRLEGLLYGDLPENQVLMGFDRDIEPQELLRRYNLANAQGILYRAVRMKIWLGQDFKTVFRYIKLAQLIHEIRTVASGGYEVLLDGPASIMRRTQKYGIHMARFLPGLLLARGWRMSALIDTEKGPKTFYLDEACGLHSYYHKDDPFDSALEQKFFEAFQAAKTEWCIHREADVIDLKVSILIPDFTFTHPDGRRRSLEIVGFWTPEYLETKLAKLKKAGHRNLIIAVNENLRCSKEDFQGQVISFKTGLRPQKVLDALENRSVWPSSTAEGE